MASFMIDEMLRDRNENHDTKETDVSQSNATARCGEVKEMMDDSCLPKSMD